MSILGDYKMGEIWIDCLCVKYPFDGFIDVSFVINFFSLMVLCDVSFVINEP